MRPRGPARAGHGRIPGHRRGVRLPRSQPTNPGRAHRHRGNHRARPGGRPAGHRRRRILLPAGAGIRNRLRRPGSHRRAGRTPRHRDSSSGSTWRPSGPTAPSSRSAGTLTVFSPPSGPGVRVDTLWPGRIGDKPAVRFAAGQAHHRCARVVVAGGGAQGPHRAGRVQHRGRPHQHRIPARAAERRSDRVRLGEHRFPR